MDHGPDYAGKGHGGKNRRQRYVPDHLVFNQQRKDSQLNE